MPDTNPSTAPGSIPALQALPIPPYGMEVFTDSERDKVFTTLHFKHKGGDQAAVLSWIGAVLDELAAAGMPASARIEIELTPDPARSTPTRPKLRGHLKVPVDLP